LTTGTVSQQYTYGSKGQLLNSIRYSATTNETVFTEYTYDDQPTPTQTQLNLKGHPIIAAIYGENTSNIKSQQTRYFQGNGLNGRLLSQQLNTIIYTYNSKKLPIERKFNNVFSADVKYTYTDCD
jgi:putative IMPACT (imprinted ancient) family translation regulator